MEKIILPTSDLGMKKILASEEHKDILGGLVYDFFDRKPERITLENPYSIREYEEKQATGDLENLLRETRRDVTATLDFGFFTAELQVNNGKHFAKRAFYYAADLYCHGYNLQSELGQDRLGKPLRYASLKPVYALCILDYDLFREDSRGFRIFSMLDAETHEDHPVKPIIQGFLELRKERGFKTDNQRHWRHFFKTGKADEMAPEYIKKAAQIIRYSNLRKEERDMATALERAEDYFQDCEETAYLEGKERGYKEGIECGYQDGIEEGKLKGRTEGREEGRTEGRTEGREGTLKQAISGMLGKNFDDSTIAEILNISMNELQRIKAEI